MRTRSFAKPVMLAALLASAGAAWSAGDVRVPSLSRYFAEDRCDQVNDKRYFRICYDYAAKGARYVGYVLDGDKVNDGNIEKRPAFYPEKSIPKAYRTYPSDYTRNEFHADRGHLAPDASFDWSGASLRATYSMANIIPQFWRINRKTWIKAERYERMMAVKLGRVSVLNGVEYGGYRRRLAKSGIAVPVAFWKAVWNEKKGLMRCFLYRNERISKAEARKDRLRDHLVDCAKLLGAAD